ncbi:btb/poz-like protein [Grosmannia clavigera kw1407]|uniref:Btb/poz-like protein n=1 Tax=Grosmannia clavigera (strain kw1407 / UAMH 11150) TaxID=655863 RepID=F0XV53_GROCL|nr:btb/poz-like protein [Grosmannia clavigera kw1407]EFW98634.1 btb/poz-like protein [Grosmannia clavigera kw1407]
MKDMNSTGSITGTEPVVDIFADGDVILVVGPQAVQLRVHSLFLQSVSKVFQVMFGQRWSEGRDLSKDHPKSVVLEEDNAEAMQTICCVIHHRSNMLPTEIPPEKVLEIGIVSGKYDLASALKYVIAQWLHPSGTHSILDSGYLAASAFLFDDAGRFQQLTLTLILDYATTYRTLLENKRVRDFLPWQAVCEQQNDWLCRYRGRD